MRRWLLAGLLVAAVIGWFAWRERRWAHEFDDQET